LSESETSAYIGLKSHFSVQARWRLSMKTRKCFRFLVGIRVSEDKVSLTSDSFIDLKELQMKAMILESHGDPNVLKLVDRNKPEPGPGQVLVRVRAASVNIVDVKVRQAGLGLAPKLPTILGCDMAGDIVAVGDGVTAYTEGQAVYGCVGGVGGVDGTYAEFVVADVDLIAAKAAKLSYREAAALPLVTITAWEGLLRAGVSAGSDVVVRGGTGGVGHVAVQLAKAWGAKVTATVSDASKAALAKQLGADQTANYREQTAAETVAACAQDPAGFDVVYDSTGLEDMETAFELAKPNGQVASIVSLFKADLSQLHLKGLSLHLVFMLLPLLGQASRKPHGEILRKTAELVVAGQLKPLLDPHKFTLEQVPEAHALIESGKAVGKVVIDI
jgi:NADPH2:quinone reductase